MGSFLRDRHHRFFLLLIVAVAATRIALLLVSQYAVCGDEAAVGIMAKHVLERGERPVFAWHEHYNGGAAVTAYLATLPLAVLGISERALKLVPLALSLLALLTVYLFVRSSRDGRSALWAALLYGTTVSLLKWSFDARGGYEEGQPLIVLTLWVLHRSCRRPGGAKLADDLLLGTLCGFGVYLLPLFLPVGATALLFLLARCRLAGGWWRILAWAAGAAVGGSPLLLFRAQSGPVGLDLAPLAGRLAALPLTVWLTLTSYLPGLLAYDNLEGFPETRLVPNLVEYGVLLFAVAALCVLRRAALGGLWRSLRRPRETVDVPAEAVLLVYLTVYLLLYAVHPLAGQDARHLLFLDPPLSMLAGLGLADALAHQRDGGPSTLARAAALTVALALGDRAGQTARLFADDFVYGPLGRSDPRDADAMVAFLDAHRIDHVMTGDWDLSWRIVYRTRERITATHSALWLGRLLREKDLGREGWAVVSAPGTPGEEAIRRRLVKRGLGVPYRVAGRTVYVVRGAEGAPDG